MLKINGSAVDNHPHPPFFCAAVADRLAQLLTPALIRRVAHMVLSEKTQSFSLTHTHTHTRKQMHTSQSSNLTHSNTQRMWTRPTRPCYAETKRVKCSLWRRHTHCESSLHSNLFHPAVSPVISIILPCVADLLHFFFAYPHFVTIIHYGLAFWHACKLANYRMASCH